MPFRIIISETPSEREQELALAEADRAQTALCERLERERVQRLKQPRRKLVVVAGRN